MINQKAIAVFSLLASCMFFTLGGLHAQDEDTKILNDFVKSRGNGIISFDATNIKQFWIDKSVVARNNTIEILLSASSQRKSLPFGIQLANVNETQDCKIDILSESSDVSFSILNGESEILSKSAMEEKFINYNVYSTSFHLENTQNLFFNVVFSSKTSDILSIKKIILSFSQNKNTTFLVSPGSLKLGNESFISEGGTIEKVSENSFKTNSNTNDLTFFTEKTIILSDKEITSAITIKNIGKIPVGAYVGFRPYTNKHSILRSTAYPYKETNQILSVVSSQAGTNSIIVDSIPTEWEKNCTLALNAKKDFSDIPNLSIVPARITEVKPLENGQAEIVLNRNLSAPLDKNMKLRIHNGRGGYIYTNSKRLNPGEEVTFTTSVKKDENNLKYLSPIFPKGVYCVKPIIVLVPTETGEHSCLISDYVVSY